MRSAAILLGLVVLGSIACDSRPVRRPTDAGPGDATADAGCSGQLSDAEALALFRDYLYTAKPNFNPDAKLAIKWVDVPRLWDELTTQIVIGGVTDDAGSFLPEWTFALRSCVLYPLTTNTAVEGVISAVVRPGVIYFTNRLGSGTNYTRLGRYSVTNTTAAVLLGEMLYGFHDTTARNLFVAEDASNRIRVEQGLMDANLTWTDGHAVGWLNDDGQRLTIVDSDGNEIAFGHARNR